MYILILVCQVPHIQKIYWHFDWYYIKSTDELGKNQYFTTLSLQIHEHGIPLFIYICNFSQCFFSVLMPSIFKVRFILKNLFILLQMIFLLLFLFVVGIQNCNCVQRYLESWNPIY